MKTRIYAAPAVKGLKKSKYVCRSVLLSLLEIGRLKSVCKQQDLQIVVLKLNKNISNFQPLEVVSRGSETQLQVAEILNNITLHFKSSRSTYVFFFFLHRFEIIHHIKYHFWVGRFFNFSFFFVYRENIPFQQIRLQHLLKIDCLAYWWKTSIFPKFHNCHIIPPEFGVSCHIFIYWFMLAHMTRNFIVYI